MRTRFVVVLVLALVAATAAPAVAAGAARQGQSPQSISAPQVPSSQSNCSFPTSAVDATGTRVTVRRDPDRIVTLSPSAAQTVWEIGGRDEVVGVTQYATYLDGAETRANVSGSGSGYADVEAVVDLQPDLVLAPNTIPNATVAKLRQANLTVYRYRPAASVTDIENQTRLTGALTGHCSSARRTVANMSSRLDRVREAVHGTERPRVLYTFFGYTAGEGTFIDHLITTAGGTNVAAAAGISGYQKISRETIAEQDPEWIVRNDQQPTVPATSAYNSTTAVRRGNVVVVNRSYVSQPAPRVVQPVTTLARAFHPEAYAAAGTTASPTGTSRTTAPPSPTATSTDSPGFGVVTALVALVGALVAAGTRRLP